MKKTTLPYIFLILISLLGAAGVFKFRLDLTADRRYTLSDTSENILTQIKHPLRFEVYLEGDFPANFKQLQSETKFMLEEFRRINPNISFKFTDPVKNKMSKDTLMAMGMQPSVLPDVRDGRISQIVLFPYAVAKYEGRGISVPLISQQQNVNADEQLNRSIENLEYSLISAIKNVTQTERKNIGILVNHDGLRPDEFQGFMEMATENYNAFPIIPKNPQELTLDDFPNLARTQALVIAKPRKAFSDDEKLLLDQYIMKGGKTLWMLDAVNAEMDTLMRSKKMVAMPIDLNLGDFFFNYGLRINPSLVKDFKKFALLRLVTGEISGNPQYMSLPWPYFTLGIDEANHPITRNINPVKFEFPTSIDTLGRPGIKTKVLYESSDRTTLKQVPNFVDLKEIASVDSLGMNEKPSTPKIYAVALEGQFPSAYATRMQRNTFPNFSAKSPENRMIVIADGDVGRNKLLRGEALPLGMDVLTNEQFGNEQFLRNALDWLLDDANLIDLRNRNIEARLLDRGRISEERAFWQWLNLLLPLFVIGIFGASLFYFRRKFSR